MNFLNPLRTERRAIRRGIFADIIVIMIIVQFMMETGVFLGQNYSILLSALLIMVIVGLLMRIGIIGEMISFVAFIFFMLKSHQDGSPIFILLIVAIFAYFLLKFFSRHI